MSREGIPLALTADQVAQVLEATGDSTGVSVPLLGWMDPAALAEAALLSADSELSKSVLLGLTMWVNFPADGSPRRLKDVAHELNLTASTGHRYVNTLAVAGLLEQDPITRQYQRTRHSGRRRRQKRSEQRGSR
jgi:hypothetical protein